MTIHSPSPLRWVAAALLALAASPALSQTYEGRVTHVLSADSIRITVVTTCLEAGCPELGDSLRVEMSEIDAPESGQPHGDTASDALLTRLHETVVTVIQEGTSEQGRPIGHLYLDGEWLNGWAVSEGHAWVHAPSAQTKALHDLQNEARRQGRGLWAGQAPVPPWQWREGTRTAAGNAASPEPPKEGFSQIAPGAVDGAQDLMHGATRAEPNG